MNRSARVWFFLCLLGSIAELLSAPARLNLFIWSEYIDPKLIVEFEQRHDCKVVLDYYEDAESMLAKLQAGGASQYDLAVPPDYMIPALVNLKLVTPLDRSALTNFSNLDSQFIQPASEGEPLYAVPYQWGTLGILLRKPGTGPIPDSWAVMFDPKQPAGTFVLMDSMRDTIGAVLKYKGHSVNSVVPTELKEARDILTAAKGRSLGFEGSVGGKNRVLARTCAAAIVYSGEGVRAMREDPGTVYFVPKEGSIVWLDNLVLLAKAPNRKLAEQFINFVLEPEPGARISQFTGFSTPNAAARKLLPSEDLQNPALYPPANIRAKLEHVQDLRGRSRIYDEIWTQVKSK